MHRALSLLFVSTIAIVGTQMMIYRTRTNRPIKMTVNGESHEEKAKRSEKSGKYKMEKLMALVAPHPSRTRKKIRRKVRRSEMVLESDSEKKKKKEEGGIPSMWDYDRRCMPREFIGLGPETFLVELPRDPPTPPGLLDRAFEMVSNP